ncbi:MAG: hypothetical protein O3A36_00590 [bacterium]|nr:hypothetical protein [bacterium]
MFRKTTLVICVLIAAVCGFTEKASAQFIAGSYGVGLSPWWGTVPNAHRSGAGWTPSPIALTDINGRVTGSYNPVNGRLQGQGFMPPSASHYGHRNGEVALYVPMDVRLGGVVIEPQNRRSRRHNRRW